MRKVLLALVVMVSALGLPARAVPPVAAGALASENVDWVGNIPDLGAVGYRIIGDLMYTSGVQGIRIFDLSLGIPVPVGALQLPHWFNEDVDTNGEILLVAADHAVGFPQNLYVIDVSNPRLPLLVGTLTGLPDAHTITCINDCDYGWIGGGNQIEVIDLRTPSAPRRVGRFDPPGSVHDVNVDETGIAWVSSGFGGGGLFGYDTTDPINPTLVAGVMDDTPGGFNDDFTLHNSLRPNASAASAADLADGDIDEGELLLVTEEDWLAPQACARDGQFQTGWYHTVDGKPVVERLDGFNVGAANASTATQKRLGAVLCSAHYFGYADGIAAVAWYEQGVRFIDVSDPRDIRQVGYFMPPTTEAFHVAMHNGYIYTFDLVRGMDILRLTDGVGAQEVTAPALRDPLPGRAPHPKWGWACRIPV